MQLAVVIKTWALLLFCRSARVVNQSVSCSPLALAKPVGDTAVFTCQCANMNVSEYKHYWYREYNESHSKKVTELKEKQDSRKYSTVAVTSHTFELKILNLTQEDTGRYYLGLISISSARPVIESNRSNLTVTEIASTAVVTAMQEEEEEEEENRGWNGKEISLPFLCGAGLILIFLAFLLFQVARRKKEEEAGPVESAPLEEEPPATDIFTVNYEILEFSAKAPPKRPPVEKTEYATIVFPACEKSPKQQDCLSRARLP